MPWLANPFRPLVGLIAAWCLCTFCSWFGFADVAARHEGEDPSIHRRCRPYRPNMAPRRHRRHQNHGPIRPPRRFEFTIPCAHPTAYTITADLMKVAFQAPSKLRAAMPKGASFPIIWDSGASISVTNEKDDFNGTLDTSPQPLEVKGVSQGVRVSEKGTVVWHMMDTRGMLRTIKIPALYIPEANTRLLSTSSLLKAYKGEQITQHPGGMTLSGILGDHGRRPIEVHLNQRNNIPTSYGYRLDGLKSATQTLANNISTVHATNLNLTPQEKELVKWHNRLGHMGFRKVQALMRTGVLATSEAQRRLQVAACKIVHPPTCAACQFGKQRQRSAPGKRSAPLPNRQGALKKEQLLPGQRVAVDHFVCSTKGRLFESRGRTKDEHMYTGGALFVDMATGRIDCLFQKHLNTHETIRAKEEYEMRCRDFGVMPQQYISDNGSAFTSRDYTAHLRNFQQIYRFAGVGAHHHNGVAERSIQSIMSIARTMMLHAAIHWPAMADSSLWPMAVQYATYLYNNVPDPTTGISPNDLFTRTRFDHHRFHDVHVWGCPVYILDKKISDGNKLPRWKPRSHRGVFMGLSPLHASSVPLVLNPETGAITPQYHVVFDDQFSSVAVAPEDLPNLESAEWVKLFGDSTYQFLPDDEPEPMDVPSPDDEASRLFDHRHQQIHRAVDSTMPPTSLPTPLLPPLEGASSPPTALPPTPGPVSPIGDAPAPPTSPPPVPVPARHQREDTPKPSAAPLQREPPVPSVPQREPPSSDPTKQPTPTPSQPTAPPSPGPRRSSRNRRPVQRLIQQMDPSNTTYTANHLATNDDVFECLAMTVYRSLLLQCNLYSLEICKAAVSDPDTLSFDQILLDPDLAKWKEAAAREIEALESKGTWIEVPTHAAKTKILPGTWVFRRKRAPTGIIKKFKGRYCVRDDLQEGEFDTFAPVVAWSTIRLVLVFALTQGWKLICVDFSNAFVQAHLKEPVWIHLPRGYRSSKPGSTCLQLNKSLYGLSIAPRLWYEHLRDALLKDGFKQCVYDQCLLLKPNMIIFLYVDDCGVVAPNQQDIDDFVERLNKAGFELTQDGDFGEYLGIKFHLDTDNNTITMTQPGLTKKIITAAGMEDCNPNRTPAGQACLGSDPDGPLMKEKWSYSSLVGMLLYLSTNTRPDISYAVSQVARFGANPKQSHASAIKMIVRYLAGTKDKGTIFTPNNQFKIDCYVDADFAGLHGQEPENNPLSARSRTGYILFFCGCPLLWKSQLQSETALSTFHAEYVALSAAMRQLIVVQRVLQVLIACQEFDTDVPTIHAEVFEDNNSAYLLANNQKLSDRSKWLNVKLHFFWEHINNGFAIVSKIDTNNQRADYLTKGLTFEKFEYNRKQNQGW